MSRPFEIGDLVVSRKFGTGTVKELGNNTGKIIFESGVEKIIYSLKDGLLALSGYDKIIHIRRHRKGSKEARDIVARLARRYKKSHKTHGRTPEYVGWYRSWYENIDMDYPLASVYYEEKSMLK